MKAFHRTIHRTQNVDHGNTEALKGKENGKGMGQGTKRAAGKEFRCHVRIVLEKEAVF